MYKLGNIKNKIMLDDNVREKLKREGELIVQNHEYWESQITSRSDELNILLNRSNVEDYPRIEQLQSEMNLWQRRGEIEQKILEDYTKKSQSLLFRSFCSGISSLKLGANDE